MSNLQKRAEIAEKALIHAAAPVAAPASEREATQVARTFELPTGFYAATVAGYLGFIAVMCVGLADPGLAIPMVIFAFFIAAGFGIPAIWTRMQPDHPVKPMSWGQLKAKGIQTHTGVTTARDAAVQVLILPTLIFIWGLCAIAIRAIVA